MTLPGSSIVDILNTFNGNLGDVPAFRKLREVFLSDF